MGKFIVRISIVLTAVYMITSYLMAQFYGVDILRYSYMLLFELCVVIYSFSEGKYHCKFIKWTMLGIFVSDMITHLDYYLDFIPLESYNYLFGIILCGSCLYSCISAIRHYHKVRKLKRGLDEIRQRNERED